MEKKTYRNTLISNLWHSRGFTLVELIVVVTILAILGTIAFVSFNGYTGSARDSARIENMSNLRNGLSLYQIKSGAYPMPEDYITITASGSPIGFQWFAKDQVASFAGLSKWGTVDPADPTMYTTYSVNATQDKMQLMSFLEDGNNVTAFVPSIIPSAFASTSSDYSKRSPMVIGDTLGILIDSTGTTKNQPLQEKRDINAFTGVEIMTTTGSYSAVFSKADTLSNTNGSLAALKASYNISSDSLPIRDPSLLVYFDMSSSYYSGGILTMADLSGHGNHGRTNWLLTIGWEQGLHSLATKTTGVQAWAMATSILLQTGSSFSVNMVYKINSYKITENGGIVKVGIMKTDSINIMLSGSTNVLFRNTITGSSFTGSTIDIWEWRVLSMVYNGNNLQIYENGVLLWSLETSWFIRPANSFFNLGGAGDKPDLTVDDIRIYNRALSDGEIQALYNATK